jgi:4'-phosphopantetheinyl transferase
MIAPIPERGVTLSAPASGEIAEARVSFHATDAADQRDGGLDRALALLDAGERARASRMRPAGHRARWITAHALQRRELASFLGCPPDAVRYGRSPQGRPYLAAPLPAAPDFNISHSGDLLLLGIATRGRIGVDVEGWVPGEGADRTPLWDTLSPRERAWTEVQHDPFAAFVRLWTRKEAIVKALGLGLPDDLAALDVCLPDGAQHAVLPTPWGDSVRVADLPAPPGYHAAVALTEPDVTIHLGAAAAGGSIGGRA